MIEIKNIKKTFGDKLLFETKEIRFPSTGLIVIKGENGCGKTTFFNMLSFIDTDYEGTVLVDGVDYRKESDAIRSKFRRDTICYILQKQNFICKIKNIINIMHNGYNASCLFTRPFFQIINEFYLTI